MGRYEYSTKFNLTNPVNDYDAAVKYLTRDDMTQYLKAYIDREKSTEDMGLSSNQIESIKWDLKTESVGKIDLVTNCVMSPPALDFISDWVSSQNSDGLGEGFEQQPFAEYYDLDDWGYPDEETYDMCSFDWQTNHYKFKLVSQNESRINNSTANIVESILNGIPIRQAVTGLERTNKK